MDHSDSSENHGVPGGKSLQEEDSNATKRGDDAGEEEDPPHLVVRACEVEGHPVDNEADGSDLANEDEASRDQVNESSVVSNMSIPSHGANHDQTEDGPHCPHDKAVSHEPILFAIGCCGCWINLHEDQVQVRLWNDGSNVVAWDLLCLESTSKHCCQHCRECSNHFFLIIIKILIDSDYKLTVLGYIFVSKNL